MDKLEKLQTMIDESNHIVFFGGAGVSTASGIKDFRSPNGIYSLKTNYRVEDLLSIKMFQNKPKEFYAFYKSQLNCMDASPNIIHTYLKQLEDRGKLKGIITQNIDGLHTKANSKVVYELHGSIYRNYCVQCHAFYDASYVFHANDIPICKKCGGIIKPDVVLYGEMLPDSLFQAIDLIKQADMLIVAGTSLTVEPAASLVRLFQGKYLVILNYTSTFYDKYATLVLHEDLKEILAKLK